ncbi:hypothetical protein B0H63DRAFT_445865 [Podospora didyma]|uniref:Uncharacterized protein n=1 Tax=Podospora didyma TaxID=330526 RepID=A0AAE0NY49_9PEZI|nr:hypothetical protein B0H63DRAFT_445865 [Podospora didyma]
MAESGDAAGQQVLAAQSKSAPSIRPRSFKRIRLVGTDDLVAFYPIVASFVKHPESAFSVEELIVGPPEEHDLYSHFYLQPLSIDPVPPALQDEVHDSLIAYTKSLDLGADLTDRMLKALALNHLERKYKGSSKEEPVDWRSDDYMPSKPEVPDYHATIATLIISLCPNITSFRFNYIGDYDTVVGQYLLMNNYGKLPTPVLQKVTDILLHPVTGNGDPRLYDNMESSEVFRYFHRLPAVRTVSLQGFDDAQADNELIAPKTGSLTLKTLRFLHVDLGGDFLSNLMRIPKALEEFVLIGNGLMNTDGGSALVYAKTIAKCLVEHRDTLKILELDAGLYGHSFDEDEHKWEPEAPVNENEIHPDAREYFTAHAALRKPFLDQDRADSAGIPQHPQDLPNHDREYPAGGVGSLHDFVALTRLSIRIGLLLGYDDLSTHGIPVPKASYRLIDALPPQLEFLRLYGYKKGAMPEVDAHVNEFLEKKAERFPQLVTIEGIDAFLPGSPGTYAGNRWKTDEDDFWQRPRENMDWVEV